MQQKHLRVTFCQTRIRLQSLVSLIKQPFAGRAVPALANQASLI